MRIVLLGMMGKSPFAGVSWQVLHYLEGLRRLGHDVLYLEDTGDWPYDPGLNAVTDSCGYTVEHIARMSARVGMLERWGYRAAAEGGRLYGISETRLAEWLRDADALINLSGATILRDEHRQVPVRIYLETDPGLPQIEIAFGRPFTIDLLDAHTHHFTFGENIGAPCCALPAARFRYKPTRQPVVVDWWATGRNGHPSASSTALRFTTIGNWKQSGKDVEWNGEIYTWSKHHEFMKFMNVPEQTPHVLELALSGEDDDARAQLRAHRWRVTDALALSLELEPYRAFIAASDGEFTVAKDQNVRLQSGWFSDRSATYLAAGKPVVTQDTGFGEHLPTGEGLFAFRTVADVVAAFDAIASDYAGHSAAAREIAHEYFRAETVVGSLLERAGLAS